MRHSTTQAGTRALDPEPEPFTPGDINAAFHAFVSDARFPCLGGKGALHRGGCTIGAYGELGAGNSSALPAHLSAFASRLPAAGRKLLAFIAVFPSHQPADEAEFEQRLWKELQWLNGQDDPKTGWDPAVSDDPDDPHFAFSFGGHAFFVIGMHPRSSRISRRFAWPALVFNPRTQFDRLRAEGRYDRLRDTVRARDIALQGSANPSLADFGERSEARQYSGRPTDDQWRCPFRRNA
jgi:uncharacterized protein